MPTHPDDHDAHYRLRGTVDGVERRFDLPPGVHRVGTSSAAEVCLPVAGVSRQHALVRVTGGGVVVEDRGSTNGTFVDGNRVRRIGVAGGATVRFGPVALTLEAVAAAEQELAIDLEAPAAATTPAGPATADDATRASGRPTTLLSELASPLPRAWLELLETWIGARDAGARPATLLPDLRRALEVEGCAAVAWPAAGEPVLQTASGRLGPVPALDDLPAAAGAADAEGQAAVFFLQTDPVTAAAVLRRPPAEPRGLLIWGPFEHRLAAAPLLRAVLRLLRPGGSDGHRRGDEALPGRRAARPLRFPPGYHPGKAPAMRALYRQMEALARSDLPVLVRGETGVGKELVARTLHRSSPRAERPFVAINCAAIPGELLEAELFGIEKGVATGVDPRPGTFRQADGGTLFLDEIGDMGSALQAKLLRALQEGAAPAVGGRLHPVDVRVLAATNADLAERMDAGTLRPDLYYRLAGSVLEVPPLRRRRDDLPELIEHFLRAFAAEAKARLRGLTAGALERLVAYRWPGNVRELEHEIRRLVVQAPAGGVIASEHLAPHIQTPAAATSEPSAEDDASLDLAARVEALERRLILEALRRTGGRQMEAARLLSLSRNGLAKKMKRFGIKARDVLPAG